MSRKSKSQTIRAQKKLYRMKLETAKLLFNPRPAIAILVLALIGIFISTIFISLRFRYDPIDRNDAASYQGILQDLDVHPGGRSGIGDVDLIFSDNRVFSIDTSLTNEELISHLKRLYGVQLAISYNARADSIIELSYDSTVLIQFDSAQERLLNVARAFCAIGIVFAAVSTGLMVWSIRMLARLMREKRQYFAELEEWKKSVDWEEIQ